MNVTTRPRQKLIVCDPSIYTACRQRKTHFITTTCCFLFVWPDCVVSPETCCSQFHARLRRPCRPKGVVRGFSCSKGRAAASAVCRLSIQEWVSTRFPRFSFRGS